jgi:transcription elongation factor GreA
MVEKTKLTKAGYKKLQDELRNLIDVVREEVKVQLAEARAQGDLSENADYDAARNKQAEVEARIRQIEDTLANAELIEENSKNKNKVSLGSTVTLRFVETGIEASYMIVSAVESDGFNNKISNASPVGAAVVGKTVGDIVEIPVKKPYKVEIVKLEN